MKQETAGYFPLLPRLELEDFSIPLHQSIEIREIITPKDKIPFQYNYNGELLSLYEETSNFLLQLIIKSELFLETSLALGAKIQYYSPTAYLLVQNTSKEFYLPEIPFNDSIIQLLFLSENRKIIQGIHWECKEKKIIIQEDNVKFLYFFPVFSLILVDRNMEISGNSYQTILSLVSSVPV